MHTEIQEIQKRGINNKRKWKEKHTEIQKHGINGLC